MELFHPRSMERSGVNTDLHLTEKERAALLSCIAGELDNDDGRPDEYMNALRRVVRKLEAVKK